MTQKKIRVKIGRSNSDYEINIGSGVLESCGTRIRKLSASGRAAIISNRKVFALYGDVVTKSLENSNIETKVFLIGDGERYKNLRTLESALNFLSEQKFTRSDCVISLGGGVVGDLAGFAASIYLRGISHFQIPTTLLSMIDSSVGGKTGVNSSYGKNLIGTFHQPDGVLIDTRTLQTLPQREFTAGFCEAIKQAAISGGKLFSQTEDFLDRFRTTISPSLDFNKKLIDLLAAQIAFKAKIVQGDERESADKTDASSRKILNFGHTLAHALEKLTNYKYLLHGEAVGFGILFAAELSKKLGLLGQDEVNLLNGVVHRAGTLPPIPNIDPQKIFEAFEYDKKQAAGSLQWILLKGIGKPVIVPHVNIPKKVVMTTLKSVVGSQ